MREGGTDITFYAKGSEGLQYWFGAGKDNVKYQNWVKSTFEQCSRNFRDVYS